MAYIVGTPLSDAALYGPGSSLTIPISGEAQAGDYVFLDIDHRFTSGFVAPSGYTATGYSPPNNLQQYYKKMGATPDTSITLTTSESMTWCVRIIRGAHPTNPIDAYAVNNSGTAVSSINSPSLTTNYDNSLVLSAREGTGNIVLESGLIHDAARVESYRTGATWGHFVQPSAGACPSLTYQAASSGGANNRWVLVAIRDAGNDEVPGHCTPSEPMSEIIYCSGHSGDDPTNTTGVVDVTSYITSVAGRDTRDRDYSYSTLFSDTYAGILHTWNEFSLGNGEVMIKGATFSTTQNLSGEILSSMRSNTLMYNIGEPGAGWFLGDGTNAMFYEYAGRNAIPDPFILDHAILFEVDGGQELEELGTFNSSSVTQIGHFWTKVTRNVYNTLGPVRALRTGGFRGGSSASPLTFDTMQKASVANIGFHIANQSGLTNRQYYVACKVRIGDGSTKTYFEEPGAAVEWPYAADTNAGRISARISADKLGLEVKPSATDYIDLSTIGLNFGNLHRFEVASGASTSGTVKIGTIRNATVVLRPLISTAFTSAIFDSCSEITQNSATLDGATIQNCAVAQTITVTNQADFEKLQNVTWRDNDLLAIKITGDQSGTWSASGMSVSGGGGTYDIEYTGTTDFSIQFDLGSGFTSGRTNNSSTGTLTVATPTTDVTVTSSEAGSDIKLFDGGTTQTATSSTTGTSLAYTYSGTKTWFYTVQKAGFTPVRGSITGTDQDLTVNVTLEPEVVYDASHGLTYSTDYAFDATTRTLTIVSAQEGRNIYSSLIDEWITRSAFFNRDFPISPVGPDRFDFTTDGTTAASIDSGDIQYWRGAGMEWQHATTGNATHKFCSIKGVGTNAATVKGFYQYAAGSGTTALSLVNNNVDQVIQFYSDPNGDGSTADGYDRSTHLVLKLFDQGYYQARADVLSAFGITALEAFEYTLNLQTTIAGFTGGDQGITITTLTDHTSAPIDPGSSGDSFSFELVDPGANSAAALAAQVNYDVYADPTATLYGLTAFNWPDIIIESGGNYETQNGVVESKSAGLGFYVSRSSADHPGFLRFESDTAGNYYVPTVFASASVTGMRNEAGATRTLLHIYNKTAAASNAWQASTSHSVGDRVLRTTGLGTENTGGLWFRCSTAGTTGTSEPTWNTTVGGTTTDGTAVWTCYNALQYQTDPASATYAITYVDGEEYANGDLLRIRFAEIVGSTSFHSAEADNVAVATSGWSAVLNPTADSVYATNAKNGSTFTQFALDTADDDINLVADTDFAATELFAWYCYALTDDNGLHNFYGAFTAVDEANYRANTAVASILLDETIGAFVKQTDVARIYRDDGVRPTKDPTTGGYGIAVNYYARSFPYDAGGGGFTASDRSDISAIKGKTDSLTFTETGNVDANIQYVNDVEVTGTGQAGDEWGP